MCVHSDGSRFFGNQLVVGVVRQNHDGNLQHDALAAALSDAIAAV